MSRSVPKKEMAILDEYTGGVYVLKREVDKWSIEHYTWARKHSSYYNY